MHQILKQVDELGLSNVIPNWDDFDRLCDDLDLTLHVCPMGKWKGLFTICDGEPGIMVNADLPAPERLIVGLHELFHSRAHGTRSRFYCNSAISKTEYEANAFAALVLLPRRLLVTHTLSELLDAYQYPRRFLWFRKRLFEQFDQ